MMGRRGGGSEHALEVALLNSWPVGRSHRQESSQAHCGAQGTEMEKTLGEERMLVRRDWGDRQFLPVETPGADM